MKGISSSVLSFFDEFENAQLLSNYDYFMPKLLPLIEVLKARIENEEKFLYPSYLKECY